MDPLGEAQRSSALVNSMLKSQGCTLQEIILALVKQEQALVKRLMMLEALAPRKIKIGDTVWTYRCPDEFIPVEEVNQ